MKMLPNQTWMRSREQHNPLRNFTLARAIQLAEAYPRGEYADLMWTLGAPYNGIETADADLSAIISRRTSALLEMDWNAKAETGDRIDATLAAAQEAAVEELMNGIDNLYEAIEHLAIAFVRGFAHCEKITDSSGFVTELRPVDQWHVVRDGIYGGYRYNPGALQTTYAALDSKLDMPKDRFVTREVKRPAGRIALMKFVRANLSETDWGAFTEQYGAKNGVVEMPPDISPEDEDTYLALAQAIAQGGSGAMPHGSKYYPNSGDKGSGAGPFAEHLAYWTEKLVLVGTNGKLTMLTESGSGTLAGTAHAAAFDSLSRADARTISELITKQVVNPYLKLRFPGQPSLAYWEMAFREEVDAAEVIDDAVKLDGAGYRVAPAELAEKTGYQLDDASGDLAEGQEGPLNPVQRRANRREDENGVITAEEQGGGQNAPLLTNLRNRQPGTIRNAENDSDAAALPDLETMLAGALSGTNDAWVTMLATAMAQGVDDAGVEDEDEDEPTPASPVKKARVTRKKKTTT